MTNLHVSKKGAAWVWNVIRLLGCVCLELHFRSLAPLPKVYYRTRSWSKYMLSAGVGGGAVGTGWASKPT